MRVVINMVPGQLVHCLKRIGRKWTGVWSAVSGGDCPLATRYLSQARHSALERDLDKLAAELQSRVGCTPPPENLEETADPGGRKLMFAGAPATSAAALAIACAPASPVRSGPREVGFANMDTSGRPAANTSYLGGRASPQLLICPHPPLHS